MQRRKEYHHFDDTRPLSRDSATRILDIAIVKDVVQISRNRTSRILQSRVRLEDCTLPSKALKDAQAAEHIDYQFSLPPNNVYVRWKEVLIPTQFLQRVRGTIEEVAFQSCPKIMMHLSLLDVQSLSLAGPAFHSAGQERMNVVRYLQSYWGPGIERTIWQAGAAIIGPMVLEHLCPGSTTSLSSWHITLSETTLSRTFRALRLFASHGVQWKSPVDALMMQISSKGVIGISQVDAARLQDHIAEGNGTPHNCAALGSALQQISQLTHNGVIVLSAFDGQVYARTQRYQPGEIPLSQRDLVVGVGPDGRKVFLYSRTIPGNYAWDQVMPPSTALCCKIWATEVKVIVEHAFGRGTLEGIHCLRQAGATPSRLVMYHDAEMDWRPSRFEANDFVEKDQLLLRYCIPSSGPLQPLTAQDGQFAKFTMAAFDKGLASNLDGAVNV